MQKTVRRIIAIAMAAAISLSVCFAIWSGVVWPKASGGKVDSNDSLTVDHSQASSGFIMCKGKSSKARYKLRIVKGDETMTYDLNTDGKYEVFPLQMGSGTYKVSLYKNKKGNKYSSAGEIKITANLDDENGAFLAPSQYVNYDQNSAAVLKSEELCAGLTTDREKFEAIREWIRDRILYDYIKEVTVASGTLPDIEGTMSSEMGICQDLAALAACMLRVQGIPTKMAIGYRNRDYHAWNYVLLDGKFVLYDPTKEVCREKKDAKYTVERYY